jgi:hypothetical protein
MRLRLPGLLPALTLGMTLALVAPSFAQNAPLTLPPPGEAASDKVPPRASKKPVQRKQKAESDGSGLALPGGTRSGKQAEPTFSDSAARPKKYVPAEFDTEDSGSGARPFVTPTGRAGVGMRF